MTIRKETAIRILVIASVVVVAVLLVIFGDTTHAPQTGPGTPPGTSAVVTPFRKGPPYSDCEAAHADGRYNIPRGDPAYNPALDRDDDGIACDR
jgi:hypothetical protein